MSSRFRPILALACCALGAAVVMGGNTAPALPNPGTEHYWSYQPVRDVKPPAVHEPAWPHNDIDQFILAKLEAKGLKPVADADPATLMRRVYFDLVGLPPAPADVDAYLKDQSPDRYEKLVDRLLASPQFGERWGRHWLDVARYGESLTLRGFLLKDAWRYRDYVIESFNADRPFDRFMQEQVAGDLLPAATMDERRRQLIATEFLTLGNINLEEQDKKQLEMDVVDEQINALGTAFLGQTIGCARCHDHKFDPIPTRDYYALAGILHSTKSLEHGNVSKNIEIPLPVEPAREEVLKKQDDAVAAMQVKLALAKAALAKASGHHGPTAEGRLAVADLPGIVVDDNKARQVGTWTKSTTIKSFIGDGYLIDNNEHHEAKSLTFQPELAEGGKYEVRFAYTPAKNRASNVSVTVFSADGQVTTTIDERKDPPIEGHFVSLGEHTFDKGSEGYVLISNEGANSVVVADAVQFIPADVAAALKSVAAGKTPAAEAEKTPVTADTVKSLQAQIKKMIEDGPKRDEVLSVRENKTISDCAINMRGNVHSLGAVVPRGFLEVVRMDHVPAIPPDESGRRELGQWLANPQNPLPARVMANRTWHWLFGVGIVRTVDNFGTTGESPSHPELLDYLASQFVAGHWSVKSLVRQIVLSHTYQLATEDRTRGLGGPTMSAVDPENRLLSRQNRRRLDAECIRDSILSISGQLTPDAGGPTYKSGLASDFGFKQTATCRSVYLPAFRNAPPEIFTAFDCADPSVSTGRRNVSTVAPQALFILNSPFALEQSKFAAERLLKDEPSADDSARLSRAYELTLGRSPTDAERKIMLAFLQKAGGETSEEAWTQVFHALFASIDFRYEN